jgi:hypothetical protein
MAAVELKGVVQFGQPLGGLSVPAILDPSVGLHEDGRTKVGVGVPPVGRTRRGAACTENALVHAVQLGPILSRLQELGLAVFLGRPRLQPGFDGTVLFVKVAHIGHEIFNHVHVGKLSEAGAKEEQESGMYEQCACVRERVKHGGTVKRST